jgi:two-component system chemotaxis response regulator CheY
MRECLLVDDSPIMRKILGVMLARLGFAIVEAETGEQALARCQDSWPELALIDWSLPEDGGIALVQMLRKLPGGERMKMVMCTSERSVAQIETAVAAGADEYVTMPFGLEILQTKLGYLGFDLPAEDSTPEALKLRRQFSRVGFAGMTVAEPQEASYPAGQIIFATGEAPDFAYIVMSGQVALGGKILEPFALFGEQALVETMPRPLGALALTDCSLMKISRQRFQGELAAATPFLRNWIECLSDPSNL